MNSLKNNKNGFMQKINFWIKFVWNKIKKVKLYLYLYIKIFFIRTILSVIFVKREQTTIHRHISNPGHPRFSCGDFSLPLAESNPPQSNSSPIHPPTNNNNKDEEEEKKIFKNPANRKYSPQRSKARSKQCLGETCDQWQRSLQTALPGPKTDSKHILPKEAEARIDQQGSSHGLSGPDFFFFFLLAKTSFTWIRILPLDCDCVFFFPSCVFLVERFGWIWCCILQARVRRP